MNQYSDFETEILAGIASQFGLSYEQITATYLDKPRPFVRAKVIRLMMTDDLRRWKRAWRIYFADNGPGAPRSYLMGIVSQHRHDATKRAFATVTNKMLAQWAAENGLIPSKAGVA